MGDVVPATWGFTNYQFDESENALFNSDVRYDDQEERRTWWWAEPRNGGTGPSRSGSSESETASKR